MRNTKILILGFLLILLASPNANAAVTLPFSDDFESYTVGSPPPPPWTYNLGGPGIVTTVQAHSDQNSVVVSGGPYSCDSSVVDLGTDFTDFLQYEGWFHYNGGQGRIGFHEQFQNMLPVFNAVGFDPDGNVWFGSDDRDTYFNIKIYSGLVPGWHHVMVRLNFEDLLGSVWLDGNQVVDSVDISPKDIVYEGYGSGPLRHIGFSHYVYNSVYFDDFSVTEFLVEVLVEIDIKPGSYPNSVNLGSSGVIPVAILSSEDFDATSVNPDTVELAGSSVAVRGKGNKSMAHEEDVDGDGWVDLVVQVETENLDPDSFQDGYAVLTGETYDGIGIEGEDEIIIVPD